MHDEPALQEPRDPDDDQPGIDDVGEEMMSGGDAAVAMNPIDRDAGGQTRDQRGALAHFLQRLLLAVHPQGGHDRVRLEELR